MTPGNLNTFYFSLKTSTLYSHSFFTLTNITSMNHVLWNREILGNWICCRQMRLLITSSWFLLLHFSQARTDTKRQSLWRAWLRAQEKQLNPFSRPYSCHPPFLEKRENKSHNRTTFSLSDLNKTALLRQQFCFTFLRFFTTVVFFLLLLLGMIKRNSKKKISVCWFQRPMPPRSHILWCIEPINALLVGIAFVLFVLFHSNSLASEATRKVSQKTSKCCGGKHLKKGK